MSKTYSATILEKCSVADETLEVVFRRPEHFSFQAGQHIQLALEELHYSDPKGRSRVFSLCTPPSDEETIAVVFRETGSGFKKTLAELPVGSRVLVEGPLGHFTLPESVEKRNVFVAGGIGIAPFMSMIEENAHSKSQAQIQLLYANRNKESAAFAKELQRLSDRNNVFSLDLIYGRIESQHLTTYMNQDTLDVDWFVVGPPNMVTDTQYMIESLGVPAGDIFIEEFIGY